MVAVVVVALMVTSRAAGTTGGTMLWRTRYHSPANGYDFAMSVATSHDGSKVFVSGESPGPTSGEDYATVAYDAASGVRLWVRHYSGRGSGDDLAYAVAADPNGQAVFVTGQSPSRTSGEDYATVAYSASSGATLWLERYNGTGNGEDGARSIATSADGSKVFVTGQSEGAASGVDYATVAYDAVTGRRLWVRRYNNSANADDLANAVSADGSAVFVTGVSGGFSSEDYATVAYDPATGAQLWVRRYDGLGGGDDAAAAIATSPDGTRVIVTGQSAGTGGLASGYATVAYDAHTGATLWAKRYDGPAGYGQATSVAITPDGSQVVVTGYSIGLGSSYDYETVDYATSNGATNWVRRYSSTGDHSDFAAAVAVSANGSTLFVTGQSFGSSSSDFATVAYARTGKQLWVRRYNGPGNGNDGAISMAASPVGARVFVTGYSTGLTTSLDYTILAYG
jgi:hypothetical protein